MRRVARQRCEYQRLHYFIAMSKIVTRPSQMVFADEVGQEGRGSRRRRGWEVRGAGVDIIEFLDRGKHISILALYGIHGFIDFDYVEGGYTADEFVSAVQFMIVPHLRPYPEDNSVFVINNCTVHTPTATLVATDGQTSRAIGNDPTLYAHMPLPVRRSHNPGRRPRTPG